MKLKLLLSVAGFFFVSISTSAQFCLPEKAVAFQSRAMKEINAKYIRWVLNTAADVKSGKLSTDDVTVQSKTYGQLANLADADIIALVFLVMMETTKNADEDLKTIMDQMKAANKEKQALRDALSLIRKKQAEQKSLLRSEYDSLKRLLGKAADIKANQPALQRTDKLISLVANIETERLRIEYLEKLDSLNELSEMVSLRLQMYMERYTRLMETLSNLMKKISDAQGTIIANLK